MNILQFIGNDHTGLYRVEEHGQYPAGTWDIDNMPEKVFYFPPLLSFGDYDKSTNIERSNIRVFLAEHKGKEGVKHWKGMYGSEAVLLNVLLDDEEIINTLAALADYPALSDDDSGMMEIELINECWDAYGMQDFKDRIMKRFDLLDMTDSADIIREYFNALAEETNTYPEVQAGGSVYFNFGRVCEALPEVCPDILKPEYYS